MHRPQPISSLDANRRQKVSTADTERDLEDGKLHMIESSADQPCRMIHRFQYLTKLKMAVFGEPAVRISKSIMVQKMIGLLLYLCALS
jgi:hypothetical protein